MVNTSLIESAGVDPPSSPNFVVHTAFGILGRSEDTNLLGSKTVSENTERTPGAPLPHAVGVWELPEFGSRLAPLRIQDRVQRSHLVNERQVLEFSWFEQGSGE